MFPGFSGGRWAAIFLAVLSVISALPETHAVCASHQIQCANGRCLPYSWACDGEDDCGDNSDEKADECQGSVKCSDTEFRCRTGRCIPHRWQCDGENDCDDHSDEDVQLCQVKNCTDTQFACKNKPGECVPIAWVCDSNPDCSDATDELGCSSTCTNEEFACTNGRCIQKHWFCDGENDCGDESDEGELCRQPTCPPDSSFTCGDKTCNPNAWRCDGDVDCADGSDEVDCPPTPGGGGGGGGGVGGNATSHCNDDDFQCADGLNCVHLSWRCDGSADCPDSSDERNCSATTCRPDQFACSSGECIPGHLQCSGVAECEDGASDEADCSGGAPNKRPSGDCADGLFDCGGGLCIAAGLVCDGRNDCGEWQDEPVDRCGRNECRVANGGCAHECIDTPWGFRCDCRAGYTLSAADNSTCLDVDECLVDGVCSQICVNEKGTFKCECHEGYSKDPRDRTRCKADEGHAALLFTHRTDIRHLSLEHDRISSVVNDTHSSTALDFHFRTGMLFWSDVHDERIYKAPIDEGATAATVVVQGDVVVADGLAVDWVYDHIFWTDSVKKTIEVADLEGQVRLTVISDHLHEPRAIAVDPLRGWLFWSDWGANPRIERAAMDGSHRQVLVDSHIKWPNGITLDYSAERLYWVDAKMNLIASCNFDGSKRRVVLANSQVVRHPFSITIFEDWIYWTDWEHQSIMRANKFNGSNAQAISAAHRLQNPMVVHVYHPYRQPEAPNHCLPQNGRCSHMCLPAPQLNVHSPKILCACPADLTLSPDGLNCQKGNGSTPSSSERTTPSNGDQGVTTPDGAAAPPAPAHTEPPSEPEGDSSGIPPEHKNDEDALLVDDGTVAGIVIAIVAAVVVLIALAAVILYRQFIRRNATSMNFDNPVYRKTTEDKFALQKNIQQASRKYPAALPGEETTQPLNSDPAPGTNEYV